MSKNTNRRKLIRLANHIIASQRKTNKRLNAVDTDLRIAREYRSMVVSAKRASFAA